MLRACHPKQLGIVFTSPAGIASLQRLMHTGAPFSISHDRQQPSPLLDLDERR